MHLPEDWASIAAPLAGAFRQVVSENFVALGSVFSIASLACALGVSVGVVTWRRLRRRRRVRWRVVLRALAPRRWRHPSHVADLGFVLFNILVAGALFGWALLSTNTVAHACTTVLRKVLTTAPLRGAPPWLTSPAVTLMLFVAYEFGYYVDHWLSHRVPTLWAIHKPHHAAETLTPLTVFRVHPLESLKLMNILAVVMGATAAACDALVGPGREATLGGRNILFLSLWFAIGHLQHSNLWLTIPGPLGRLLISPAHHQLHHSADPRHFGKNLGNFLSVFDRLFGTLREPGRDREPLVFGVGDGQARPHSVTACLIRPLVEAGASLRPSRPTRASG